jgi:hypothetical protein
MRQRSSRTSQGNEHARKRSGDRAPRPQCPSPWPSPQRQRWGEGNEKPNGGGKLKLRAGGRPSAKRESPWNRMARMFRMKADGEQSVFAGLGIRGLAIVAA